VLPRTFLRPSSYPSKSLNSRDRQSCRWFWLISYTGRLCRVCPSRLGVWPRPRLRTGASGYAASPWCLLALNWVSAIEGFELLRLSFFGFGAWRAGHFGCFCPLSAS
jgi:hypothetical protein